MQEVSLYFHIPFCRRRCGYCDFNTFAGMNHYIPDYVKALCGEVEIVLNQAPEKLLAHTIFFGGGTPSLLQPEDFGRIFASVRRSVDVSGNAEITLEANPETVTRESITALYEVGFNRISFGMQSASGRDLHVLDRQHDNLSVLNAVQWSKQAGFKHINLDLIFGIPGQSLESWRQTLELASRLDIDHFSIYSLILEEGTRLKRWVDRGLLDNPDEDLAADMYEFTMDYLNQMGYQQYEISNWARSEEDQCRHNLQYWRYLPYLGFGAGAHGFWQDTRTENAGQILDYIRLAQNALQANFPAGPAVRQVNRLSLWDLLQENMMVSLRLTQEGVSNLELKERYQVNILEVLRIQIDKLLRQGLLESVEHENRLRLTRKGRLFGNRVFAEFVGNPNPNDLKN